MFVLKERRRERGKEEECVYERERGGSVWRDEWVCVKEMCV